MAQFRGGGCAIVPGRVGSNPSNRNDSTGMPEEEEEEKEKADQKQRTRRGFAKSWGLRGARIPQLITRWNWFTTL